MINSAPQSIELLLNQEKKKEQIIEEPIVKPKVRPIEEPIDKPIVDPIVKRIDNPLPFPDKDGQRNPSNNHSSDELKELIMNLPDVITERFQLLFEQFNQAKQNRPQKVEVEEEKQVIFEGSQCSVCEEKNIRGRLYHSIDQDQ